MKKLFVDTLKNNILVLDGELSNNVGRYKLDEKEYRGDKYKEHPVDLKGFTEILTYSKREAINNVHEKYLKAGADVIRTNTFNANKISLSKYKLDDIAYELNYTAARLSYEKAAKYSNITRTKPRYVAGVIGTIPTDENNFDKVVAAYDEQIKGLFAAKVDLLLIESVTQIENLKAVLIAIENILKKRRKHYPVFVSGLHSENSKSVVTEDILKRFASFTTHVKIVGIGANCNLYPEQMYSQIKEFSTSDYKTIFYPSTIDNSQNKKLTSDEFVEYLSKFIDEKIVNIIGGGSGTNPDYIRKIVKYMKKINK